MKIPRQNETRWNFDAASQRFWIRFERISMWNTRFAFIYDIQKLQIPHRIIPSNVQYLE